MKPSDHFKSMDDVRAFAEGLRPYVSEDGYQALLQFCGIGEQEGISETIEIGGVPCAIDRFLVPIVLDLNERGFETLACCSGLCNEHKSLHSSGYLSIAYQDGLIEKIKETITNPEIKIEESECYLKPAICITIPYTTEEKMEQDWEHLWVAFSRINS